MLDILLIVVIGGMGTMYGAIIGGTLYRAGAELSAGPDGQGLDRRRRCRHAAAAELFHPDRWLLWLGILFICQRLFLPTRDRRQAARRPELACRRLVVGNP